MKPQALERVKKAHALIQSGKTQEESFKEVGTTYSTYRIAKDQGLLDGEKPKRKYVKTGIHKKKSPEPMTFEFNSKPTPAPAKLKMVVISGDTSEVIAALGKLWE